jgi:hypothetical protein
VVLDCHVLTFDGAGFVEAFAERGHIARVGIDRPVSDKPDHWHRLLRARRERPRDRRAAQQRDEVATFQLIEWHSMPLPARAELQDTELAQISQRASVALSLAGWKP